MSVWRSPIPNKLPIVPKKEGAPAGEKTGDGRPNGKRKGSRRRKSCGRETPSRKRAHIPSDFFSSPVSSDAYLYPQTDPYSGEFPFAGIYRRTKGDPRFFCGKTTVCFLRKMCPCRKGEQGASLWPGEGGALKDIWHSCGKRFGSRGGVLAAGCNRFHFSVRQWIFGAPRQNRADPRNPQSSRAPAAWDLEAGSRKSRGRKLYLLPYRPLFSPAKPAKGRTREPAEGAAGDRKTKIGGTRDRRSNFAVFQIPFVPGIDKIGGKGAFFLADPIGERGDVVF